MKQPVELSSGRVALVTGAASGIGLAIARSLAEHGVQTILSDIDEARGREVSSQLANASFIAADLGDPASCRQLAEQAEEIAGRIDVLVNNAGLQHVAPITEFAEARWRQLMEIMLNAPFLLTQKMLPGMMERHWGRIINMGSVHSLRASAYKSAYVAAKHGLLGLTRVTAIEAASHGITCNQV